MSDIFHCDSDSYGKAGILKDKKRTPMHSLSLRKRTKEF